MAKAKQVKLSKGEVLVGDLVLLASNNGVNQESEVVEKSQKLIRYVRSLERKLAKYAAQFKDGTL